MGQSDKNLQRVLNDERERERQRRSGSHDHIIARTLKRSLTAPPIPGLKREISEAPSLAGIPTIERQPALASRGSTLSSKRFSQREVDLSSLAQVTCSKAAKQSNIDAELREAISGIKKPNRELAGKSLAETAEKRTASTSHSRSRCRNNNKKNCSIDMNRIKETRQESTV